MRKIQHYFRNTILSGLAVLVPLGLTVYILRIIISTGDRIARSLPDWVIALLPPPFPGSGLIL